MERYECHSHSMFSNLRLLDAINKPEDLIDRAIELGLSGIALTDHEAVCGIPDLFKYYDKIKDKYPNFKVAAGDEIYLCKDRSLGQKYYHFILNAKNKNGWELLKRLSSRAWMNSYFDRAMERVVTTYDDLKEFVHKYPNSLIATTACLGGELSTQTLNLIMAEKHNDESGRIAAHNNIVEFILMCKELFGEDFYIECAPGCSKDQILVNQRLVSIAQAFDVKMVIGTDAHYLKKEDRYNHESYLNSKGGEREVAEFYEYSYLQSTEEIFDNLRKSNFDDSFIEKMFNNSMEIYDKIEMYSIWHNQTIPSVSVKDYPKSDNLKKYPVLNSLYKSDDVIERYWVNQCVDKLDELNKTNDKYLSRLEEEATTKRIISDKLGTNIFAYPVVLQHFIDKFWELGSTVGAGRGSSCSGLNHYLLGVTQLDPLEWDFPWFRYLNEERVELPDIDVDLAPSKRPAIINYIKRERGQLFNKSIDALSKQNLGCTLVATYGTESSKSAILTACRGYRSEEYPTGIDVDIAQYMSSLVPIERGFAWTISEMVYGNEEKNRKPITTFINEVNKYPGLLSIILGIEGLVKQRGSHASGVIINDEDPYEFLAYMKTPSGEIITQFDLHSAEAMGATKYDFLVTEVQDKITEWIRLMQNDDVIDHTLSLKEVYDKYLHPNVIDLKDEKTWITIQNAASLDLFQLDSDIGRQGAKKIKPTNMQELSAVNGLIRLMTSEKGAETPMEKYIRFRKNPQEWENEMNQYHLTEKDKEAVRKHIGRTYGIGISQEQLMLSLMDKDICGFSLKESNGARKTVAKKQMDKIADLREEVWTKAVSENMAEYIWMSVVAPGLGYSFSDIHSMAYSLIGYQTAYVATHWDPIYWNTACLIVNSGSLEDNSEEEIVSIYAPEHQDLVEGVTFEDLSDRSGKIKKTSSTDYSKLAKAIGSITSNGIKVSLVDINESDYSFKPNVKRNEIMFGLKGVAKINESTVEHIIAGRPYTGIKDFVLRSGLTKTAIISLIKAGAFDRVDYDWASQICEEPRIAIMAYYISIVSEPKKKLTLQNFNGLVEKNLIPEELTFQKRVFIFNKYLKANQKRGNYYIFDLPCEEFYNEFFDINELEVVNGITCILQTKWDKIYKTIMEDARIWLKDNQTEVLKRLNELLFKETWDKYAAGNVSAWEMESVCFYSHPHELINIDTKKYGIANFFDLSYEPEVDYYFKRKGKEIPIFKTYKIMGTVISKNDTRASISLLTPNGVVNVKFTKEHYAMYARQLSEIQSDGSKKVVEKGWMTRGTMLMLTGFRREDTFVLKSYKHTPTHQIYKIININGKDMQLEHNRYGYED